MLRVPNIPAHLLLLEPWPIAGECSYLGGCRMPATDGGQCAGHAWRYRRAQASAQKAWALAGVDLGSVILP